ncbi:hypothetical protein BH09SUM1_BH09SUM1_17190 [soil metagenome]
MMAKNSAQWATFRWNLVSHEWFRIYSDYVLVSGSRIYAKLTVKLLPQRFWLLRSARGCWRIDMPPRRQFHPFTVRSLRSGDIVGKLQYFIASGGERIKAVFGKNLPGRIALQTPVVNYEVSGGWKPAVVSLSGQEIIRVRPIYSFSREPKGAVEISSDALHIPELPLLVALISHSFLL